MRESDRPAVREDGLDVLERQIVQPDLGVQCGNSPQARKGDAKTPLDASRNPRDADLQAPGVRRPTLSGGSDPDLAPQRQLVR